MRLGFKRKPPDAINARPFHFRPLPVKQPLAGRGVLQYLPERAHRALFAVPCVARDGFFIRTRPGRAKPGLKLLHYSPSRMGSPGFGPGLLFLIVGWRLHDFSLFFLLQKCLSVSVREIRTGTEKEAECRCS